MRWLAKTRSRLKKSGGASISRGFSQRPDISLMGVLSGLEIACWDIIGKATDQPVHNLLGGKLHQKLRSYSYLYPPEGADAETFYADPDASAEIAERYIQEGFTAVKFDPAGAYTILDPHMPSLEDIDRSEQFLRALREVAGARADLLFGTHGQFSVAGAKRMAAMMQTYDPLWFEEPTPPERPEMMAQVARATSIPIATGERLTTKYEFARILETGAASILQMNLGRVGGLLEAKKIAGMAETYYAHIAPHLYCADCCGSKYPAFCYLSEFSDSGINPDMGRVLCRDSDRKNRLARWLCDCARPPRHRL